jgi:hypothetical protein
MVARSRYPTDHELILDVRPAYGVVRRFRNCGRHPAARHGRVLVHVLPRQPGSQTPSGQRTCGSSSARPGRPDLGRPHSRRLCSIASRGGYRQLLNSRTIPILDRADAWMTAESCTSASHRRTLPGCGSCRGTYLSVPRIPDRMLTHIDLFRWPDCHRSTFRSQYQSSGPPADPLGRTPSSSKVSMSDTPSALTEGTPPGVGVTAEAGEIAFPGCDDESAQAHGRVGL